MKKDNDYLEATDLSADLETTQQTKNALLGVNQREEAKGIKATVVAQLRNRELKSRLKIL